MALQPAQRVVQNEAPFTEEGKEEEKEGESTAPFIATLSKCPCDFHVLWYEYKFGIGGRNPAKDFTPSEQGKVKVVYAKRKLVWTVISCMILSGYSAQQAVDKIYEVYGQVFVTEVIKKLRRDEKEGGHNELR